MNQTSINMMKEVVEGYDLSRATVVDVEVTISTGHTKPCLPASISGPTMPPARMLMYLWDQRNGMPCRMLMQSFPGRP